MKLNEIYRFNLDKEDIPSADWKETKATIQSRQDEQLSYIGTLNNGMKLVLMKNHTYNMELIYLLNNKPPIKIIGKFGLSSSIASKDNGYSIDSTLATEYQGQGLGYQVYKFIIKNLGYILIGGTTQSLGASYIWTQLWKTPGIHVYGAIKNPEGPNKYFEVEPDEINSRLLSGNYDIYDDYNYQNPLNDQHRNFEINFSKYQNLVKDMIIKKEITQRKGTELIKKYKKEYNKEKEAHKIAGRDTYLIAMRE